MSICVTTTNKVERGWEAFQAHQHTSEGTVSYGAVGAKPRKRRAFRSVPTIRIPDCGELAPSGRPTLLGHIPKSSFDSPRCVDTQMASSSQPSTPLELPTPTASNCRLPEGALKRKYPLAPKKSVVAAGGVGKRRMRISRIGARIMYQFGSMPMDSAADMSGSVGANQSDVEAMLHPLESAIFAPASQHPGIDAQFDLVRASDFGEHRALFNGSTKKRLEDYLSPRHRKTCGSGVERELSLMMSSTHLRL